MSTPICPKCGKPWIEEGLCCDCQEQRPDLTGVKEDDPNDMDWDEEDSDELFKDKK